MKERNGELHCYPKSWLIYSSPAPISLSTNKVCPIYSKKKIKRNAWDNARLISINFKSLLFECLLNINQQFATCRIAMGCFWLWQAEVWGAQTEQESSVGREAWTPYLWGAWGWRRQEPLWTNSARCCLSVYVSKQVSIVFL